MFRLRLVLQNNIARTARPYACRDLVGKHADPPLLQCLAFLPRLCDRTKQPQTSRALHNVLRLPPESPAGQNSRWRANLAATSAVVSRESRSRQRSRGQAGYHNVLPFLHESPVKQNSWSEPGTVLSTRAGSWTDAMDLVHIQTNQPQKTKLRRLRLTPLRVKPRIPTSPSAVPCSTRYLASQPHAPCTSGTMSNAVWPRLWTNRFAYLSTQFGHGPTGSVW